MKTQKKKTNRNHIRPPDEAAYSDSNSSSAGSSTLTLTSDLAGDIIEVKKNRDLKEKSRLVLRTSIALCISMLIVLGMFEWRTVEIGSVVSLNMEKDSFEDLMDIPQTEQPNPPAPKIQSPQIIEVTNEEIIEEIEVDLDIEMTEDTKIEEVIFTEVESLPEETADEIFTIVEQQPFPVGGMQAFYDFVSKNLKYPAQASRSGIEGRVFIQFVVEKNGDLTDIHVVKGIGGGCDDETVRVLTLAPNWIPGKQRGLPVRVQMILPIMFKIAI